MSYILDALRKSEQQRQATQPAAVTDRLLVDSTQTAEKPNKWLKALLILNLLFVLCLVSFLLYKLKWDNNDAANLSHNPELAKTEKQAVTGQSPHLREEPQQKTQPQPDLPAISQLVESKKSAENQRDQMLSQTKESLEKKIASAKKKTSIAQTQVQLFPKRTLPEITPDQTSLPRQAPVDVKELPYPQRNGLPDMNINVFSYAQKPEDRFVIIDMVKYKPGQFIKGSAKLKAILEDSIIVEEGGKTFKVERP